jgi:hypothetical protein
MHTNSDKWTITAVRHDGYDIMEVLGRIPASCCVI